MHTIPLSLRERVRVRAYKIIVLQMPSPPAPLPQGEGVNAYTWTGRVAHPWNLDSGNPCRNDGATTIVLVQNESC